MSIKKFINIFKAKEKPVTKYQLILSRYYAIGNIRRLK